MPQEFTGHNTLFLFGYMHKSQLCKLLTIALATMSMGANTQTLAADNILKKRLIVKFEQQTIINTNRAAKMSRNSSKSMGYIKKTSTGAKADYSNFGNVIDVAAPGGDTSFGINGGVLSTLNAGINGPGADSLAFYQGTSMAAPHVAGVAALFYEVNPNVTPDEVKAAILNSARPFPGACNRCGSGITDANAAIDELAGTGGGLGFEPINFSVNVPNSSTNSWRHYTLGVGSGASALNVNISGGTGDADLYIRFAAQPTTADWDFRPYLNGNNESVTVSSPQSATWHISVRAFSRFCGVTLSGSAE